MKNKKIIFGILLIILAFSTIFISVIPSIYSQNSAGKIDKKIDVDFKFLEKEDSKYVLLYFGYVGCTTICMPSLSELSDIYKKVNKKKFSFYFVNLLEDTNKQAVESFAKYFNKDFKSIYLNKSELNNIVNILKVKVLPSIIDKYEINHSSFLYLLEKEDKKYKQISVYTARPFDKEFIINDLNKK